MENFNDKDNLTMALENVIGKMPSKGEPKQTKVLGTPLITQEDLFKTKNLIAILARLLIIEEQLTREKLFEQYNQMAAETGLLIGEISSGRGNLKKDIVKPNVSWSLFEKLVRVAGYDIADVSVTLVQRQTGEVKELKYSDVDKYENPNAFKSTLELRNLGEPN